MFSILLLYSCQEVLLDNMKIGMNIAKNAALRENIFMMAVCIELRIPLFLVGKPGSSKSLAKSIIADSMRGKVSQSDLLRDFKEVIIYNFVTVPEKANYSQQMSRNWYLVVHCSQRCNGEV